MSWTKKLAFVFAILSIGLYSCGDDISKAQIDLNFKLTYEDEPLVAFEEIAYPLGFQVFFTKYSMFLSDIILHGTDGDYKLSDVEFIDLLSGVNDPASAASGKTLTYLDVPANSYTGISFNIGVPAIVNTTAPADYDPSNPLSNTGEYWEGWKSFIFHKIEGKMDEDGDGSPEAGIALHIGSDQAFRSIEKNMPINIDSEQETISINFDLADILNLSEGYYDFMETPQIHHLGVLPKALPILDNTQATLSIEQL